MAEDLEQPLLNPDNFNRDGIDLVSYSEEAKARELIFGQNRLEEKPVLRDGQWQEQDASVLVPGDIVTIKLGDIIPADARLLEGDPRRIIARNQEDRR